MGKESVVRIGVFIPGECQLLDQACVDIFGGMSHEYLSLLAGMMPQAVIDLAPSVKIHYIGSVKAGEPIPLTSSQRILATNHYNDPEVAPGKLDIVIVPGPDPTAEFEQGCLKWLREQGETQTTDILSVCTGIMLCGEAELLNGKMVCGPRGMQDMIVARYGKHIVQKGEELRWVQDGNFWSSGGVTNGNDLVSAYARQSKYFPKPLVELVLEMFDVEDRPQQYGKGQSAFLFTTGFNLFRAWLTIL
ncbi:ThiJ/PfpI family protein [Pseudomassariella vexata]|uniref:ThiJ/PfpI family protein n=1 Tax=Pseudomassariella vexata TaxID=1141098 RepID=A0A1Y2E2U4_9PEZI|nr:ThiJ/PfpI family protein [Pseudomassariella vexata]ORY65871.1 ThiJ/PfpI family protein [Pseudomassariella vexata]